MIILLLFIQKFYIVQVFSPETFIRGKSAEEEEEDLVTSLDDSMDQEVLCYNVVYTLVSIYIVHKHTNTYSFFLMSFNCAKSHDI